MLHSCKYCGRIHDKSFDCGRKPIRHKERNDKTDFRSKSAWQRKRNNIKKRDNYICQLCFRNIFDIGFPKYNFKNLEVHHIVPLEENFDLCLDDENLITVCSGHHKLCDSGQIHRDILQAIAREQSTPRGE